MRRATSTSMDARQPAGVPEIVNATRKPKAKTAKPVASAAKRKSKQQRLIDMLHRPDGATIPQMSKAPGWEPHRCAARSAAPCEEARPPHHLDEGGAWPGLPRCWQGLNMRRGSTDREGLTRELASLRKLDLGELKDQWRKLYGVAPPTRFSRLLLTRAIAYRLQERALAA